MEEKTAVNTTEAAAPQTDTVAVEAADDLQAKYSALEAEKNKALEEAANYRLAFLKEKNKNKDDGDSDSDEDARMEQIARKALADSRLADIAKEQQAIIDRALKENRELKLAQMNRKEPAATIGSHSESIPVKDGTVSSEQLAALKARGWTDKDIERYKKNLARNLR